MYWAMKSYYFYHIKTGFIGLLIIKCFLLYQIEIYPQIILLFMNLEERPVYEF